MSVLAAKGLHVATSYGEDEHAYHNPIVAEIYDHIGSFNSRSDVGFYIKHAERAGSVLEIGCGTGRLLIPIARAGVSIVGLDNSAAMLAVCRRKLSFEPKRVLTKVESLEVANMDSFSLERQFKLITLPFYAFNYLLTIEDQLRCLSTVHQHLCKQGILIMDLPNPYLPYLTDDCYLSEFGDEPDFFMPDGRRIRRRYRISKRDLSNQVIYGELIYYIFSNETQDKLVTPSVVRYLYRYEAEHLLLRCGFELKAVYSDYEGNAFGSMYPGELILIASKI